MTKHLEVLEEMSVIRLVRPEERLLLQTHLVFLFQL